MMEVIQYVCLFIYLFALLSLLIYGMNCYFLMMFYRLNYLKALKNQNKLKNNFYKELSSKGWPGVTIQLPIYNELYVVERLIKAVCKIDYPRNLIEIQVLDDSTDDTARIAKAMVEKMKARGFDIVYIHRNDRTGYKAGALKEGLTSAKGELIGIFDADFVPNSDFLKESVPYFIDPNVGMLPRPAGVT